MIKLLTGVIISLSFSAEIDSQIAKPKNLKENIVINNYTDSLTYKLNVLHKQGYINGFSVAIVNRDKFLYIHGFGLADKEKNIPYSSKTLQPIASISKTVIGVSLMKAHEMGKLDLDDDINSYLPFILKNPYFPDTPITIRHLATHTSTIIDTEYYDKKSYIMENDEEISVFKNIDILEKFNDSESKITIDEFVKKLLMPQGEWYKKENYLKTRPGSIFEYSNVGATLAAYIIECATGIPFDEFSAENILKPLKMNSSGWSFKDIDRNKLSVLYNNTNSPLPKYSLITYPDGGLITSAKELGYYLIELIKGYEGEGSLLSKESYQQIFKEQLKPENLPDRDAENIYDDEYNTGIFMGVTPEGYIGHSGSDPGISTLMFFNPKTNIGRVLIINTSLNSSKGVEQFFSIWNTLGKCENKL